MRKNDSGDFRYCLKREAWDSNPSGLRTRRALRIASYGCLLDLTSNPRRYDTTQLDGMVTTDALPN